MASATRVRVELSNRSYQDRERSFKILLTKFKRECNNLGIMHDYKEHQFFESKSRKARMKKKEATIKRLREDNRTIRKEFTD